MCILYVEIPKSLLHTPSFIIWTKIHWCHSKYYDLIYMHVWNTFQWLFSLSYRHIQSLSPLLFLLFSSLLAISSLFHFPYLFIFLIKFSPLVSSFTIYFILSISFYRYLYLPPPPSLSFILPFIYSLSSPSFLTLILLLPPFSFTSFLTCVFI